MSKYSEQELQALVNQSGIIPCARLPKPDPHYELVAALHQISAMINGAVVSGARFVHMASTGFPKYSNETIKQVHAVLMGLGYKVTLHDEDEGIRVTVSGWV